MRGRLCAESDLSQGSFHIGVGDWNPDLLCPHPALPLLRHASCQWAVGGLGFLSPWVVFTMWEEDSRCSDAAAAKFGAGRVGLGWGRCGCAAEMFYGLWFGRWRGENLSLTVRALWKLWVEWWWWARQRWRLIWSNPALAASPVFQGFLWTFSAFPAFDDRSITEGTGVRLPRELKPPRIFFKDQMFGTSGKAFGWPVLETGCQSRCIFGAIEQDCSFGCFLEQLNLYNPFYW